MADKKTLLEAGTGAANSADFDVNGLPATISAFTVANLDAETGVLKLKNSAGTYDAVYDLLGTAMELSETMPQITIHGAGTYRVEFAARTKSIGVDIQYNTRN